MKIIYRVIGLAAVSIGLALTAGCDTTSGAIGGTLGGAGLGAIIGRATGNTALGAGIGAVAGGITGAVIGHVNEQQREKLREQSPQTLAKIQHNDYVIAQGAPTQPPLVTQQGSPPPLVTQTSQPAPVAQPLPVAQVSQPPPASPAPSTPVTTPASQPATNQPSAQGVTPLSVDDIKALASAGVKKDVIISEIQKSKSVFTQQDVSQLQQATPPVDPAVIDYIKTGKQG
jgi:Glycine zipper